MKLQWRGADTSGCLRRMAGELHDGAWAIWGDLARQRLAEHSPIAAPAQQIDITSYAEHIRRCACFRLLTEGRRLYWELRIAGMDQHRFLGNLLIQMFGNFKSVAEAKAVFDGIRERNLYSWNIMLVAYAQNGYLCEARKIFDKMPLPSVVSWNSIHAAYAQAGDFLETIAIFERIPDKDPVSWNTMIVLYAQHGHIGQAEATFWAMPAKNVVSWNSIAAVYIRFSRLDRARECFDRMPLHNAVSWNAAMSGYVEDGDMGEAERLFDAMPERDAVSWTALITGLSQSGALDRARSLFERMPLKDLVSWTAMISAYALNGLVQEARRLLDGLGTYDSVAWNAMITGYIQNGQGRAALELFRVMDLEGMCIDKVGFFNALEAAICIANLAEGRSIHAIARDSGFLLNLQVNNSLINMYGKCGSPEDVRIVFDGMSERNLVSWNAVMTAHANNGECERSVEQFFRRMILDGFEPDEIAFTTTIAGCSHAGDFGNGCEFFRSIIGDFGGTPSMDHYACMVDLLARIGQLAQAEDLILDMPYEPQLLTWRSLVAACKVHGDVDRGKRLASAVIQVDEAAIISGESAPSFVLVYNMFSCGDEKGGEEHKTMKSWQRKFSRSVVNFESRWS